MGKDEQLAQNDYLVKSEPQSAGKKSRLNKLLAVTKLKSFKKLPDDLGSLISEDSQELLNQINPSKPPRKSTVFDISKNLSDYGQLSFSMDLATTEPAVKLKLASNAHQGSKETPLFKVNQTRYSGKIGDPVPTGFPTMEENPTASKLPSSRKNLFERPQRPRPMFRKAVSERNLTHLDNPFKPFNAPSKGLAQLGFTKEIAKDASFGEPATENPKKGRHPFTSNVASPKLLDADASVHFRSFKKNPVSDELFPVSLTEEGSEESWKTDGQSNTGFTNSIPVKLDQDGDDKAATEEGFGKPSSILLPHEEEPLSDELKDNLDQKKAKNGFSDGLRNLEALLQKNSVLRSSLPDPSLCPQSIVSEEDYVGKLERLLGKSQTTRPVGLSEPSICDMGTEPIREAKEGLESLLSHPTTNQVSQLAEPSICDARPEYKRDLVLSSIPDTEVQSEGTRRSSKMSDENSVTDFIFNDQATIDEIGVTWAASHKPNESSLDEAQVQQDNPFLQLTLPGMDGYPGSDPHL